MAENFSLYTPVGSGLIITSSRVTTSGMDTSSSAGLYFDKGAGYLNGDFVYDFTWYSGSITGDVGGAYRAFWTGTKVGTPGSYTAGDFGFGLNVTKPGAGNNQQVYLSEYDGGAFSPGGHWFYPTDNTIYYFRIKRTGITFRAERYDDALHTTLLSATQGDANSGQVRSYRYVYGITAVGVTESFVTDAYIQNLNRTGGLAVSTDTLRDITTTTMTATGSIISPGFSAITQHGHCWATTLNPTTADSKTTNGAIVAGSFTSAVTGLTAGTRYYVRAYATNTEGTVYGGNISIQAGVGSSLTVPGQIAVVGSRFHYVGADGREYYLQGTGV